jgi:hypothetical protein
MPSNSYHFSTQWQVRATAREVYDIIADAESLSQWWPSVYLDVWQAHPGDAQNIGKRVYLYTKGWLPYTLQWHFVVAEIIPAETITIRAFGDFEGRGIWIFMEEGDTCKIIFDWKLIATKPLLKMFSWMLKPVFSMNHRWAMNRGQESLMLEIRRRRALTPEERAAIPEPPGPVFPHNLIHNKKLKIRAVA